MSTRKLLIRNLTLPAIAFGVFLSSPLIAQVKIGSNPTVIGANNNLEAEATDGSKVVVTKDRGLVGIGIDTPGLRLHVMENAAPVFGSSIAAFGRPGNKFLLFETMATNGGYNGLVRQGDSHIIFSPDGDVNVDANNGLVIAPWSLNPNSPGLKIMENGNVGIGTALPPAKLSVFGGLAYFGIDPIPNIGNMTQGTSTTDGIIFQNQNGALSDGAIVVQRSGASNYSPMYITRNGALGSAAGFLATFSVNGTLVGSISTNAATTFFNTTSDVRLKENIKSTQYSLSDLMKIKVSDYNYKSDKAKKRSTGFIAQDLFKIYPEAVTVGGQNASTEPWTVDYGKLTPLLVKAIQEQQAQIAALKAENEQFRKQSTEVTTLNNNFKKQVSTIEALAAKLADLEAKLLISSANAGGSSANVKGK